MTIQLPDNLESPILVAVHSGRYASLDDAMAAAAALLVHALEAGAGPQPPASQAGAARSQADLGGQVD